MNLKAGSERRPGCGGQGPIRLDCQGWRDELSWCLCVKLPENMFELFQSIIGPLSHLAWLSLASKLSHPTPHLLHTVLLQTVLHPLTVDFLSILNSPLQLLLDKCGNFFHVPCPKNPCLPVEKDVMFSVFQDLLFARPWSFFFYYKCGVHAVIDLSCSR